jgi:hypothetical protein
MDEMDRSGGARGQAECGRQRLQRERRAIERYDDRAE